MKNQVLIVESDGKKVWATHYNRNDKCVAEMECPDDNDFLVACAYLVDDLYTKANEEGKAFYGTTVCCMALESSGFSVGRIYSWENGRTANDCLEVYPRDYKMTEGHIKGNLISCEGAKFVIIKG